jgi:uncharacterized protein YprB with RNaseH-like and TPR domain
VTSRSEPSRRDRFPPEEHRGSYALADFLRAPPADIATLCGVEGVDSLDGALFLDTETTGLGGGAGTFVFLLGVGSFVGGEFEVRQYLLEDPDREAEFLDALEAETRAARLVISFHGRGFDLPRLEERCLLSQREFPLADLPHLDLLVAARRIFRLRTGRVGLQRLEQTVLGVTRTDDLPGAECPAAWYAYIRGDRGPIDAVLDHNRLDVLSLPPLVAALADAAAGRAPAHDTHSAGRVFSSAGDDARALGLQRIASKDALENDLAARAHAEAARLLVRTGDRMAAAEEALRACEADPTLPAPWLLLAKHAEHTLRDFGLALDYARRAERAFFLRSRSESTRREIARRLDRLNRKIAAGT